MIKEEEIPSSKGINEYIEESCKLPSYLSNTWKDKTLNGDFSSSLTQGTNDLWTW